MIEIKHFRWTRRNRALLNLIARRHHVRHITPDFVILGLCLLGLLPLLHRDGPEDHP
jgi:hypothetical protein